MPIPIYQVDTFTRHAFSGNPAAVCLLDEKKSDDWMQSIAAEMNLSETAFVYHDRGLHRLRWFTPETEVDLCGHATLATAHVLWETGRIEPEQVIEFYTHSGILKIQRVGSGIQMNFPAELPVACAMPPGLIEALGVSPIEVLKCHSDYLAVVADEASVRNLQPDLYRLKQIPMRGLIVTAASDQAEVDFVSRFFAPRVGVDEDPVTGSIHCVLVPYWAQKLNKQHLLARQLSRRGGQLELQLKNDRTLIFGNACTVFRGELYAN